MKDFDLDCSIYFYFILILYFYDGLRLNFAAGLIYYFVFNFKNGSEISKWLPGVGRPDGSCINLVSVF